MAAPHLRSGPEAHTRGCAGAARSQPLGGSSRHHPVRQRPRARRPGAGGDARRHPVRPARAGLLAARARLTTLRGLRQALQPGLVFAGEGARSSGRYPLAAAARSRDSYAAPARALDELRRAAGHDADGAVDDAHARVGPDTVAKICSRRARRAAQGRDQHAANALRQPGADSSRDAVARGRPPVLCDWLPWNHTFGGNHNFGIVLYNGGTLYIDDGKPMPGAFDDDRAQPARGRAHRATSTCRRDTSCWCRSCRTTRNCASIFSAGCKMLFYAAAALRQHVADELRAWPSGGGERMPLGDRPRRDRDRAVRAVHRAILLGGGRSACRCPASS